MPVATYRLQLGPGFGFKEARSIVPYLAELGITSCYLSPFLMPASDNSHGYDVADHSRLNPVLGSEADYEAFSETLGAHGMGQLIDVVPNHMGISGNRNAWWLDVLENGPASLYAPFFDIDWEPVKPELRHRVLLPILGDQYGRVLENAEFQLEFQEGAFAVRYHDTVLPIGPRTYAQILRLRLAALEEALGKEDPHLSELHSIITATTHLPARTETAPERRAERSREKQIIKRRLDTLVRESPAVKSFIEENVRVFNGVRGVPESFDRLDMLLDEQPYRVAFWRVAADEINYRRFFDVKELAAIRMEEPAVFEATHRRILQLVREGRVTGLRIDHPDGLYAPAEYLRSLQRSCALELTRRLAGSDTATAGDRQPGGEDALLTGLDRRLAPAPEDPRSALVRPFYIVVEKILMPSEPLPEAWPVDGTTGYEFLNALTGIFVDPTAGRALAQTYTRFTGATESFDELVYECKKLIMDTTMSSELNVLGHRLARISAKHRASRDFTERSLTTALREIIACFPVYRTYIGEEGFHASERDRRYIAQAVGLAKRRNPTTSASVYDFIRDGLCLRSPEGRSETDRLEELAFVMKFQQLTGPITAKGLEDTAFYRYNRLISLNEVGGAPERFGTTLDEFHRRNAERQQRSPGSLSTTSTHDTKRSEDVRARISVLSEVPVEWRARLWRWHRLNRRHRGTVDGQPAPGRQEEYFLYQALIGAWPIEPASDAEYGEFTERIQRYLFKALREAKLHVSWVNPNPEYDAAVAGFVARILDRTRDNPFLDDFRPWQRWIAGCGMYNSLSQTLLKLAAPGVPDTYQGAELWDLSLVDPDNRRPVDYAKRRALLADLRREGDRPGGSLAALARSLTDAKEDGRIKLYVIHRALTYRRGHPGLFREGGYVPLEAGGGRREHLCAFARIDDSAVVLAVVPRFLARLGLTGPPLGRAVWEGTWLALPPGFGVGSDRPFRNLFSGEAITPAERGGRWVLPAEAIFASFPVALLEQGPGGAG